MVLAWAALESQSRVSCVRSQCGRGVFVLARSQRDIGDTFKLRVECRVGRHSTARGVLELPCESAPSPDSGPLPLSRGRRRDQRDVAIWLWVHRQLTRQVGAFCCADDAAWRRVGQSRAWEHDEPAPPAGAQPRARPCALAGSRPACTRASWSSGECPRFSGNKARGHSGSMILSGVHRSRRWR